MTTIQNAIRRLTRAPAFALTAIITLALGIGGTSTVFTVVNGVLLRPLPYSRSEQLVDLSHTISVSGISTVDQSDATYMVYRRDNRVFTDVAAYRQIAVNLGGLSGAGAAQAERVSAAVATAGLFPVLDVALERGRAFTDDDSRPGAPPVVILGQRLWERTFGSDPAIVGKQVAIDGIQRTVVGIAPASFRFPSTETALWLPLELDPGHTKSAAFDFRGVARLKPGAGIVTATADLQRLLSHVPESFPGRLTAASIEQIKMRAVVRPLRDTIVGDIGATLWIVLGAVGVLLLIACANVANLFLARAEGRQRDLAVRRALGAGRVQLLAEYLAEAAVLSVAGGVLGLAGAAASVHLLKTVGPGASIPRVADVRIDAFVLAITAAIVVFATLMVSAVPVVRSGKGSLAAMLMANGRTSAGPSRHTARRALVVAQVSLALILLSGAGLLARSFARLRAVNPGFDASHALAVRMTLPTGAYPTSDFAARTVLKTLNAIAALPGVQSVGVTTKLPLDAEARQDSAVWVEEHMPQPGAIPGIHQIAFVTPDYFRAMGIPLRGGRTFQASDPNGGPDAGPPEVIVSAAFALRYFKSEAVVGKRIRMFPLDPWHTIVGVVGSVHDVALEQPVTETVYCPLTTFSAMHTPYTPRDLALVVRTTGDPSALAASVRRTVQSVDQNLPLYRVIATSSLLAEAASRTTFTLLMLGIAALVAMTIGAVGIYGVIAYLVSLRAREIGVRLALGATPADMRRLVTRQALIDSGTGVVLGVVGAAAVTRVFRAVLFDTSPTDPISIAAASVLLLLTAFAASWIPARRAAGMDPAMTLRSE